MHVYNDALGFNVTLCGGDREGAKRGDVLDVDAYFAQWHVRQHDNAAMLLHLRPDLVTMKEAKVTYPDPGSSYLTTDLLGGSPIRTYLDFADLSASGTLGDPSLASPEKGAKFFAAVTEVRVADGRQVLVLEDGSRVPLDHVSAVR